MGVAQGTARLWFVVKEAHDVSGAWLWLEAAPSLAFRARAEKLHHPHR